MKLTFCYRHIAPYHHAQLNALATAGVEVTVITYNNFKGAAFSSSYSTPPKYDCKLLSIREDKWTELYDLLDESKPEVVLLPGWGHAYALAALHWSIRCGVPCVAISDSQECDESRNFIIEIIKSRLARLFSAGFVAGQRSKEYLVNLGVPLDAITIGCDVVDNAHFLKGAEVARNNSMDVSIGLPGKYFLAVNRLSPEKNVQSIIEAFAMYCREGALGGWSLVIVGSGALQSELEALVSTLQLGNKVIFIGSVGYKDIPVYYGLASAFILASWSEPWGLVVNEAMCAGLPVLISSSCGASVELVQQDKNGYCFNATDVNTLSKLMLKVVSDINADKRMGTRSREIISEWSLDRYVAGLLKAVEIAGKAPPKKYSFIAKFILELSIFRLQQGNRK